LALNKEAVKSGCVTTKQNDRFRELHDIRRKVKIGGGSASNEFSRKKVEFPPGFTFGMPHRPSTPINEVLEHRYLHDWLNEAERAEAERINALKEQSVGYLKKKLIQHVLVLI
jgi:hypothetical protein